MKHIEGLSRAEAAAAVALIDAANGNPRKGRFGASMTHLEPACDAWLAGPRVGDPPTGITITWADPAKKWDAPRNHAIPLTDEHVELLVGRTVAGKVLARGQMKKRTAAQVAAWRRPVP